MFRKFTVVICALLAALLLASCGGGNSGESSSSQTESGVSSAGEAEISDMSEEKTSPEESTPEESTPEESEPEESESAESIAESSADAAKSTAYKDAQLSKSISVPQAWEDLAVVETPATDPSPEGFVVLFRLREKLAFEENETGHVWTISAVAKEDFDSLAEKPFHVLGSDGKYVYILAFPTDVQFLADNPESIGNYNFLLENSPQVIEDFLRTNSITPDAENTVSEIFAKKLGK